MLFWLTSVLLLVQTDMLHTVREGGSLNIPDSKDPVTDTAEDIDKEYVDKTAYSLCFMQAFFIKKQKHKMGLLSKTKS